MNGFSEEIKLIKVTDGGVDSDGFPTEPTESYNTVFCDIVSPSRTEFYQANACSINVSMVAKVNYFEYDNEKVAEYKGVRYRIVRTYFNRVKEIMELTLSENE